MWCGWNNDEIDRNHDLCILDAFIGSLFCHFPWQDGLPFTQVTFTFLQLARGIPKRLLQGKGNGIWSNTRWWFQWFLIFIPAWGKLSHLSNLTMFLRLKPSTSINFFGVSCEAINLILTPILDVENGTVKETKPPCQPTSYCPTIEEQGNNLCKSPHIFKKFHATFEGFFWNQVVVSNIFSFPYAPCMEGVPTFTINLR